MFSCSRRERFAWVAVIGLAVILFAPLCESGLAQQIRPGAVPRTVDGKPNLQGIWQVQGRAAYDLQDHPASQGMPPGQGVVVGGEIPYQPWAAAKKLENFATRKTADPLGKCYFPGVPRIMYMEFPFHIFQTADQVAITFEWSQVYRLISTNGKPALHKFESWMGDSRGRWEGDTLVVEVKDHNDKTWFDMAGNFHSDALRVTERYSMLDADTIQYEATMEDSKVFTKPWKISMPLVRHRNVDRILEYQCQAEAEEANGDFERDSRTWYPQPVATSAMPPGGALTAVKAGTSLRRAADGKPDLSGNYQSNGGGANYGLETNRRASFTPSSRGIVIEPADGVLPYQPWAREERIERELPHRGYDDPTAHCFVAGIPRSMYVPSPLQILQPPGYVVILFERMSWRVISLDRRAHIPDNVRLWQGDSVGHWEGDTLVVDTANLNGKAWLNEVGDVLSHAARVVETFTPVDARKITYRATVTDPIVYARPWTIEVPLNLEQDELLEVACHEDNGDLQNLKDVRDEFRKQQKKEK
jgi:hypothetical protein